MTENPSKQPSPRVTEARAAAQRAKVDAQTARRKAAEKAASTKQSKDKQASMLSKRRASTTMERAIADYLLRPPPTRSRGAS